MSDGAVMGKMDTVSMHDRDKSDGHARGKEGKKKAHTQ